VLQVRRSRVPFPLCFLRFFIDLVLPAALWAWVQLKHSCIVLYLSTSCIVVVVVVAAVVVVVVVVVVVDILRGSIAEPNDT
jgi:hypothetical protein